MKKFWHNLQKTIKFPRPIFAIFITALVVRFLYFPQNVYFGFDQARDAFQSQKIYQEQDVKIIGPSTATPGLFHGPLYWYLIGPFYLAGGAEPVFPAGFLLVLNALGVFLVFWLGKTLFNREVGVLAALLFAFSFEQTQYAMYFGNPGPAVLTTLLFWTGLGLAIFKNNWRGLPVSLFGLGLSVQFEFFLFYLAGIFAFLLFVFRRRVLPLITPQRGLVSLMAFLLPISTFILADLKFGARTAKTILQVLAGAGQASESLTFGANLYIKRLVLLVHDNLVGLANFDRLALLFLLGVTVFWIIKKRPGSGQVFFLLVWVLSTSTLLVFGAPTLYYTNIGVASGLLILSSFFIYQAWRKVPALAAFLLLLSLAGNLSLITRQNPKGIINDIYVQEGMLLEREKAAIDYIYNTAAGNPIVVSGMTMPLKINTTWAYLFNWYGKDRYGYLPYWAGEVAAGFPGELPRWQSQEKDYTFFSIIEPRRGIREAFVEQFLKEQEQYGKVVEEKIWGDTWYAQLVVQRRR